MVGKILQLDYDRTFNACTSGRYNGRYATFAEAEKAIPNGRPVGYDHVELAAFYRERMDKACESDYAPLFWLRRLINSEAHVFDFGGHVGVSYHGWREYLDYPDGMRWTVCDLPAITEVGEQLAKEKGADHLSFTNEITDAADCSVFLGLGAFQYLEERTWTILESVGELPPHVILNKMPLHDGETFITLQATGHAFHPYRIENADEFVSGMSSLGYQLVDEWVSSELGAFIPRVANLTSYTGMYFRL